MLKQQRRYIVKNTLIFFILAIFFIQFDTVESIPKEAGKLYLSITSPIEWYTRPHIIEEQHISPQSLAKKYNLKNNNTVLITWSNHTISDRWKKKPFLKHYDNEMLQVFTFGNPDRLENLNIAYRLGAHVYPYALFTYEYRKDIPSLLCLELDAPSMLLYGITWIIHIPYKLYQKTSYIINDKTKISIYCLLDIACNVFMLFIEIPLAICGTFLGWVVHLIVYI